MQRCSLFCTGWWPFLLFPLLLLLLFGLFQWRAVEQDVAANAEQAITSSQSWAGVETYNRGRDVLIIGIAPSEQAAEQATQLALDANGVRTADFVGDVAEPIPTRLPSLNATWQDGKIILQGELNSQTSMDTLIAQVNLLYGANQVINQLALSDQVKSMPSIQGLFAALTGMADGDGISIVGDQLTLNGSVESDEVRSGISERIKRIFSGGINNLLAVDAPVVEKDECQDLVNNLLSSANINFQSSEATIKADSFELLDNIADVAKRCPEAAFEVAGHTDSTGNLDFNMSLSKQRAQAVVDYITKLGLESERFTVEGYGPNQPIASNATREGRAQNRRIEFKIKN